MNHLAFIGGGNMASAIIGGLLRSGRPGATISVVDPGEPQRGRLESEFGVHTLAAADASLARATLVVWAVKPQLFRLAAQPCAPHIGAALQLSVMAGIRTDALVAATGSQRVVRAMPNTPALIGQGISGLYARPAVSHAERAEVETVLAPTGRLVWVTAEADLDAVTAVSGSGPAYVFYLIEAMTEAAQQMGLSAEQSRALTLGTLAGATALAQASTDPPAVLRERVTSKGGTTQAAMSLLEEEGVKASFMRALRSAQRRAAELGDEYGH
jgi:pyrroline-5-carboxylate reductase